MVLGHIENLGCDASIAGVALHGLQPFSGALVSLFCPLLVRSGAAVGLGLLVRTLCSSLEVASPEEVPYPVGQSE